MIENVKEFLEKQKEILEMSLERHKNHKKMIIQYTPKSIELVELNNLIFLIEEQLDKLK